MTRTVAAFGVDPADLRDRYRTRRRRRRRRALAEDPPTGDPGWPGSAGPSRGIRDRQKPAVASACRGGLPRTEGDLGQARPGGPPEARVERAAKGGSLPATMEGEGPAIVCWSALRNPDAGSLGRRSGHANRCEPQTPTVESGRSGVLSSLGRLLGSGPSSRKPPRVTKVSTFVTREAAPPPFAVELLGAPLQFSPGRSPIGGPGRSAASEH